MKRIPVKLGAASYDVLIANGLLRSAGRLIRGVCGQPSHCAVITSPRIQKFWGKELESALRAARLPFEILTVPDGEPHKNLQTVQGLMNQMAAAGLDRSSAVIAFGGGVIGDVAGFAASIYMRGIPIVQIPTTLLSQVDASIGGKTGVNLSAGKNLVGAFHQPKLVLIDPEVLETLPDREYRAGFFEVIKCGVIRDAVLFRAIEKNPARVPQRDPRFLMSAVNAAVKVKADIVSRDEREGGLRRILNFGHTIGHALEAAGNYKQLLHGEAVGWGMIAAAIIGEEIGVTPAGLSARIKNVVFSNGPLPKVKAKPAQILRLIRSDKKTLHGVPHFVLATQLGKTTISGKIDPAIVRNAIVQLSRINSQ